jgi:glycosyltransferase involved in cell wall biosynthesis
VPSRLLIVSFSVCPAPDRHGVGLLNVLKALAGRYAVDVLTLRPTSGELPFNERFMKTRMLRVPVGHGALGEQVEAFRRAIKRQLEGEEYDVVHLRSAWGGRAVLNGVQPPCRVVYEIARSTEGEPRAADAQLAHALAEEEDECLRRADLVLVPTEHARMHLLRTDPREGRVLLVPPGVDIDHFDWEPAPSGDAADSVVYAGRISAGRGVRLLLSALEILKRRRPVKLILAGPVDESFQPLLDEAIAQAGLAADIERLGAIDHDDIPRVLAQAVVCVAPASPDSTDRPLAGFPTKLLEYMACRRAVVAPRRSSVQEVIEDGTEGLLFTPGDAEDLARAIGRLLDEPGLRDAVAEAGYQRVRDDHPASSTRRRLLEAYARLLPASQWAPPGRAASPIDALPSHPDTTTSRHHLAQPAENAQGDRSGEIVIPPQPAVVIPVTPGEVVIEAIDFASAGEPFDTAAAMAGKTPELGPAPDRVADSFGEESRTSPYMKAVDPASIADLPDFVAAGPLLGQKVSGAAEDPDADEKTHPVSLRPRKPSE